MLARDTENAIAYLLEHRLLAPDRIVEGNFSVQSTARRHDNLRVSGDQGVGYHIKQAHGASAGSRRTLGCEARFYEFCQQGNGVADIGALVPRLVRYDETNALCVIELVTGGVPLGVFHRAHEPAAFPTEASRLLGCALGTVHRVFRRPGLVDHAHLDWLPRGISAAFHIHRPTPHVLASITSAGLKVLRIVQNHETLAEQLDRLGEEWRPDTVIHGDVKAENILICSPPNGSNAPPSKVCLVDWEFVQFGDPAWDLAGALHDFLYFWTGSMPIAPTMSADEMIEGAQYPLDVLRPAIRALWEGYQSAAHVGSAPAHELLRRSVAFSAVRLIQAAYELAAEAEDLPAQAVILLQISANLMADPELGRSCLYGLLGSPTTL